MKHGWEIKKLEDAVEFQRGLTYSKKDEVDFSDNIVLRSNNVDLIKNELDFTELKYINPAIEVQESKKVKKGSLLICTANGSKSHLGKVALIDDDYNYAFGGFMGQITPKQKLDSKFLFYLMTSDKYKKFINELSDGANINNLKFSDLGQFEIPLPPLPEQQRIVSILDEVFSAIERSRKNAEKNLLNAKELFESYLQGVFEKKGDGWEEKNLGEVYDVRDGTHDSPKYHNQGYPLVTSKNLKNHKLTFDDIKFISETDYLNINKRSKVDVGDVLFAMIGTIGNPVVIEDEPNYAIKNVALFKVGNNQNSYFLKYFLDSKQTIEKMMRDAKGTTQKFVGLGYLRSFPILVPPLKEQQTIVRQLDALRVETQKLEAVYQKKIDDLEELKKSILQKAFAGELKTSQEVV